MLLGSLLLGACGTQSLDQQQQQSDKQEELPLGQLDYGDLKADGTWGQATTCKIVPTLPPLVDPYIVVSIKGLTLRLIDRASDFEKVYPIGPGAINDKPNELTTKESLTMFPVLYKKTNLFSIDTRSTDACHIWWTDPDTGKKLPVFAGMPFLRFWGGYGIHGPITGFTQPNGGYLMRGYVSHGCVRMEAAHILELWAYIKSTPKVPVRVQREVDRRVDGSVVDLQQKWILSECKSDADCNFDGGFCKRNAYSGRSFCTARCTRYCDYDKTGYPTTFCVSDADTPAQGYCTYKYTAFNDSCRRYEGFVAKKGVSRHGQPSKKADVCLPGSQGWVGDRCLANGDCQSGLGCEQLGSEQLGICSQACSKYCPDAQGFAGTFCVSDDQGQGLCRSRCSSEENGAGCLGGFVCALATRHNQPSVSGYACLPEQ